MPPGSLYNGAYEEVAVAHAAHDVVRLPEG